MTAIAYCNPFVPPEWIAAHGLHPCRLRLRAPRGDSITGTIRGVCPYAAALVDAVLRGDEPIAAVILTTTCDQMRYAAAFLEEETAKPVFLMNVPSTWQTAAARQIYRDELLRLGRFLEQLGGAAPWDRFSTCHETWGRFSTCHRPVLRQVGNLSHARQVGNLSYDGIPLALVGGPLLLEDEVIFEQIERLGGRVVLDGAEGGERTLPAPLNEARFREDPLEAVVDAYFAIPDVFRRPNTGLYDWLGRHIAARDVRGILFRRYLACDLWHAELHRLKQWSPVPVLDLDASHDDQSALARTLGRIEAFLEILR